MDLLIFMLIFIMIILCIDNFRDKRMILIIHTLQHMSFYKFKKLHLKKKSKDQEKSELGINK